MFGIISSVAAANELAAAMGRRSALARDGANASYCINLQHRTDHRRDAIQLDHCEIDSYGWLEAGGRPSMLQMRSRATVKWVLIVSDRITLNVALNRVADRSGLADLDIHPHPEYGQSHRETGIE